METSNLLGNNQKAKRWTTLQCILFAVVLVIITALATNMDRIVDAGKDDGNDSGPSEPDSVVDIVTDRDELSTLASALTAASLIDTLNGDGPFTVLAPTNDAFDAITVPENITTLTNILTYHVIPADILSSDLSNGLVATTVNGQTLTCFLSDGNVYFYDSRGILSQVTEADLEAENGVIHIVNSVLLPNGVLTDILANIPDLSSLNGALIANGLDTVLADRTGTFTVFAPTNNAISAFSGDITSDLLLYHVLTDVFLSTDIPEGRTELTAANGAIVAIINDENGVFIEDITGRLAQVTMTNIAGVNGVIHIIDLVLAPVEFRTVVDLAVERNDLSTLVGALTAAGLVDTLSGDGPFTVFAPTNDAFDQITVPTNITILTDVLVYHVVSGTVLSTDLSSGLVAQTLNGETVTCFIDENGVYFYDSYGRQAQVAEADIQGTNGVIHIIDAVFLPGGTIADVTQNVPSLSTLNGALVANDLDSVLADPSGTYTLFAPTNEAISAFTGTIDVDVLLYHVVGQVFLSGDIPAGNTPLTTANTNGDIITVINNGTGIYIEDAANRVATVTTANIASVNGVVHVIDLVLSPTPN